MRISMAKWLLLLAAVPVMFGQQASLREIAAECQRLRAIEHLGHADAAFIWARDILSIELPHMPHSPAPLVCHITAGEFTGEDPEPVTLEIRGMSNRDGSVLVVNVFLGEDLTIKTIPDIDTWPGLFDAEDLRTDCARKLFNMSSTLPESYATAMADEGYALRPGCRMLIPGSRSHMIDLAFALSGATPVLDDN